MGLSSVCVPQAGMAKAQLKPGEGLAENPLEQKKKALPWPRAGSPQDPHGSSSLEGRQHFRVQKMFHRRGN